MILNICDNMKHKHVPCVRDWRRSRSAEWWDAEVHAGAQRISAESTRKVQAFDLPQSRIAAAGLTREARIAGKNPPSNPITEANARDEIKIFGVGAKRKTTSEKL
jgi:hypothetical protein